VCVCEGDENTMGGFSPRAPLPLLRRIHQTQKIFLWFQRGMVQPSIQYTKLYPIITHSLEIEF